MSVLQEAFPALLKERFKHFHLFTTITHKKQELMLFVCIPRTYLKSAQESDWTFT